jgi:hypothetical protein
MRTLWWLGIALLPVVLGAGPAHAGNPPATESTGTAPVVEPQGPVPMALSIRALSLAPPAFTDTGDLERVRASNGAGTSRWPPASTHVGRGVYISVMPGCIPGVDEPAWPGTSRRRR